MTKMTKANHSSFWKLSQVCLMQRVILTLYRLSPSYFWIEYIELYTEFIFATVLLFYNYIVIGIETQSTKSKDNMDQLR